MADFLSRSRVQPNDRLLRVVMDADGNGRSEIYLSLTSQQQAGGAQRWSVYLPASIRPEQDGYHRLPAEPVFNPRLSFLGLLDPLAEKEQGWIVARPLTPETYQISRVRLDAAQRSFSEEPLRTLDIRNSDEADLFRRFFERTAPPTIEDRPVEEWQAEGDEYAAVAPTTQESAGRAFEPSAPAAPTPPSPAKATAPAPAPAPFHRELWIALAVGGLFLFGSLGAASLLLIGPRNR